MLIFIYESQTAGGWLQWDEPPDDSLLREGRAMVAAMATDFAQLNGVHVILLRHENTSLPFIGENIQVKVIQTLDEHDEQFARCAKAADWTLLIAPEIGGELALRAARASDAGARLLSPSTNLVIQTSEKNFAADQLRQHGVPVPFGLMLAHAITEEAIAPFTEAGVDHMLRKLPRSVPPGFPFPAVLKPVFGAGSQDVRYIPSRDLIPEVDRICRLEKFHPGEPVSVAALCGPAGRVLLSPCRQRLSNDGRFTYLGGSLPLPPPLAVRTAQLGEQAIATLDEPLGYLGVDLVLGDDPTGADDVVIEINPRLTTSYVGLRAACRENLAAAMLDVAEGRPCKLSWRDERVEFDPDGAVRIG
jgi:predicted ATP-grasp superfamily ATP-dependent carboligase